MIGRFISVAALLCVIGAVGVFCAVPFAGFLAGPYGAFLMIPLFTLIFLILRPRRK